MFKTIKEWLFGKPAQVQTVENNAIGIQAPGSVQISVSGVPYKVEPPTPLGDTTSGGGPAIEPVTIDPQTTWPFDSAPVEEKPKKPRKPRAKKPKAE